MKWRHLGFLALVGYAASIVLANVFIGHVGDCSHGSPCVIPVGFGLAAPSGVLWVGASLFLRDLVQEALGRRWTLAGILVGALLSWSVAAPALALASGGAFLVSEAADFAVYQPLRAAGRRWEAVLASGVAGSVVDSAIFLLLAFGSLAFIAGQVWGKVEITVLCAVLVWAWSLRDLAQWQRAV